MVEGLLCIIVYANVGTYGGEELVCGDEDLCALTMWSNVIEEGRQLVFGFD